MFGRRTGDLPPRGSPAGAAPDAPAAKLDPYALARARMIEEQLRRRGVVMHSVLEAMREIPRHLFVSHQHTERAYDDEALPSLEGQTISQPFMVAIMTQELALRPGMRVLEIGTGTGYQTAILAHLVGPQGQVFTMERFEALATFARHRLEALDFHNVHFLLGDGSGGWPAQSGSAPEFDRILVTAGTPAVPPPLLAQLVEGGILVAPVGASDSQMLVRVVRQGATFHETQLLGCRFVPLVGAHAWDLKEYRRENRGGQAISP
jgi:protein-L-isoaspartate(D-aspartate) O-methyltransferase